MARFMITGVSVKDGNRRSREQPATGLQESSRHTQISAEAALIFRKALIISGSSEEIRLVLKERGDETSRRHRDRPLPALGDDHQVSRCLVHAAAYGALGEGREHGPRPKGACVGERTGPREHESPVQLELGSGGYFVQRRGNKVVIMRVKREPRRDRQNQGSIMTVADPAATRRYEGTYLPELISDDPCRIPALPLEPSDGSRSPRKKLVRTSTAYGGMDQSQFMPFRLDVPIFRSAPPLGM